MLSERETFAVRLQQSRVTSSDRSQTTYFLRMYPYPSYGAAGPVSGGLQGRQGRVLDAGVPWYTRVGKGLRVNHFQRKNLSPHRLTVTRLRCAVK